MRLVCRKFLSKDIKFYIFVMEYGDIMACKVGILIDWLGNNYASSPDNKDIACVATGKTFEDVKVNMLEALHLHIEWMKQDGDIVPKEFAGEWDPEWHLTTRAQLKYTEAFITRKALSDATGINVQQLSHYANGWRNPRPAMQRRISDGIRAISQKLAAVSGCL